MAIPSIETLLERLIPLLKSKYPLKLACAEVGVELLWLKENCTDEQLALIADNQFIAKNNFEENTEEEPFVEAILIEETTVL
jgi:hypothetical protein